LEWSGCKAGESVIVRGRNRADNWPEASVGSVKPREKQKAEIMKVEMKTFRQIHLPAAAGASLRVQLASQTFVSA
jgi:hypothetical protein